MERCVKDLLKVYAQATKKPIDIYGYGFFRYGFYGDGIVANTSDRAHDMLVVSMSHGHERKREEQSNDCDIAFHKVSPLMAF
jgi:hypothetical protein